MLLPQVTWTRSTRSGCFDIVERFGHSYESEEAYALMDQVMEFVSWHAIDESADLARERGAYPNFEGSRWSEGLVPIDSLDLLEADRGVPVEVDRTTRLDWDSLRAKVAGGIRNSTLMAIAPTASIGLVAGTTPGLDPQFSQIFSRATSSGKFLEVNRNLVEDLRDSGCGSRPRGPAAPPGRPVEGRGGPGRPAGDLPHVFQLSPYAFLNVAARAQKWIDQAISRNIYLASRDVGEMIELYAAAWRMGVKTTYYLHMMPRHTAEQSTVKVNKASRRSTGGAGGFGASKPHRDGGGVETPVVEDQVVPDERPVDSTSRRSRRPSIRRTSRVRRVLRPTHPPPRSVSSRPDEGVNQTTPTPPPEIGGRVRPRNEACIETRPPPEASSAPASRRACCSSR